MLVMIAVVQIGFGKWLGDQMVQFNQQQQAYLHVMSLGADDWMMACAIKVGNLDEARKKCRVSIPGGIRG